MKIAFVTPSWPGDASPNGITTAVFHVVGGLRARGHDVTVISKAIEPSKADAATVAIPERRSLTPLETLQERLGFGDPRYAATVDALVDGVREAVTRRGVEIVVVEETQGWAGALQRRVDVPVVVALHGPWALHKALQPTAAAVAGSRRRIRREAEAIHVCAGVFAPSRDVLERMRAEVGFGDRPAACIPNPIPAGEALDYRALDPESRRSLLFVGRFDRHKGGDVMLTAFDRLVGMGVDARLTFVGPDRGVPGADGRKISLAEAVSDLPEATRARIDLRGMLRKSEVEALRRRHGLCVIASRYENLNYTLLEPLAQGVATIAPAVGGIVEVIRDGENGLLSPPGDAQRLAEACRRLVEDPALAARLGAAGHETVRTELSPMIVAERLEAFLAQVVAERRRRAA